MYEKKMPFWDHFDELRVRLMRIAYGFLGGFFIGYYVSNPVMNWLKAPLYKALPPEQHKLYYSHVFENFLVHLKISGFVSLVLIVPYALYEVWGFVSPGLKPHEKKWAIPFIGAAFAFFLSGMAFAYYVLFPIGFKYFMEFGSPDEVPLLTMDRYYMMALKLMISFGAAFQIPVILVILGALGVLSVETLKSSRRIAFMIITGVSAVVAPPDAISMLMLMAVLAALYELSIWVITLITKNRALVSELGPSTNTSPPHPLKGESRDS